MSLHRNPSGKTVYVVMLEQGRVAMARVLGVFSSKEHAEAYRNIDLNLRNRLRIEAFHVDEEVPRPTDSKRMEDLYPFAFRKNPRNPARRNPTEWVIYHADHGISPAQMDFIKKTLTAEAPEGFFLKQIDIPKALGSVPNALYGPASGDRPVNEAAVHYLDRAGRGWKDRMVDLPPRPCQFVQSIGIREGDKFTVFTIYGGPLAPQNPADPGNRDPQGAKAWWDQHALSAGQWKGGGRTRNKFLLNPKSAVCTFCAGSGRVPNPFAFHGGRPEHACSACNGTGKK